MAKRELPPIFTTDGKPITVGMIVYGIDTCRKDVKAEKLTVIQVNEGSSRSVRLRRANSTEWVWSVANRQGICTAKEHHLYAAQAKATAEANKELVRRLNQEAKEEEEKASMNLGYAESYKKNIASSMAKVATHKAKAKELRAKAAKLLKSK